MWGLVAGVCAVLSLTWKGQTRFTAQNQLPFGHSIAHPQLSCEQVLNVAKWGQKRYGGLGSKDLFNSKKAHKIAEVFAEKIDPNHMLFLAEEIEQLKQISLTHWDSLRDQSKCEP